MTDERDVQQCSPCAHRGVSDACRYDNVRRQRSAARPSLPSQRLDADSYNRFSHAAEPGARKDAAQALSDLGRATQTPRIDASSITPVRQASLNIHDNGSFRSPAAIKPEWHPGARADGLATIATGTDESL